MAPTGLQEGHFLDPHRFVRVVAWNCIAVVDCTAGVELEDRHFILVPADRPAPNPRAIPVAVYFPVI